QSNACHFLFHFTTDNNSLSLHDALPIWAGNPVRDPTGSRGHLVQTTVVYLGPTTDTSCVRSTVYPLDPQKPGYTEFFGLPAKPMPILGSPVLGLALLDGAPPDSHRRRRYRYISSIHLQLFHQHAFVCTKIDVCQHLRRSGTCR